MSTLPSTRSTGFNPVREVWQDFVAALMRFWRARTNRQMVKHLAHLNDRALQDIGLTRADVERAMNLPYTQDPTYRLEHMAMERRWPSNRAGPNNH